MNRVRSATLLLAVAALAACQPGPSQPTARSSPATSPTPATAPLGDPIPAQDTPLAGAPPALAAAWRAYGVSIIPGRPLFQPARTVVPVQDRTGGALGPAQAAAVGTGLVVTGQLLAWGDLNRQPAVIARVGGPNYTIGTIGIDIAEGDSVVAPPCAVYPTAIAVFPRLAGVVARFAAQNQDLTAGAFPVRATYAACRITATTPGGATIDVGATSTAALVMMVSWRDDPLLGRILYIEAVETCGSAPDLDSVCA